MKLASPQLERRLRAAVRSELRQFPDKWRDYRRRLWQTRRLTVFPQFLRLMLPLGMVFMPISSAFPMAFGVLFIGRDNIGPLEGAEYTFAAYSLFITSLLMLFAGGNDRAYLSTDSNNWTLSQLIPLRMAAYLPLADRALVSTRRMDVAAAIFVVLLWLGVPYGVLAWKLDFDLAGWIVAAGVVFLELLTVLAASAFVYAYSPTAHPVRRLLQYTGTFGILGSLFAGMAIGLPGNPPEVVSRGVLCLVPYGWVNIAFVHGQIAGLDWAWLALMPAVALIGFAVPLVLEALRADFALTEFLITPSGWYGVIERGFRVPEQLPEPPPLMRPKERPLPAAQPLAASDAAHIVLAADYLKEPRWRPYQMLERLRDAALSPRERLILRFWSGTYERITVQWLVLLVLLGLVATLAWIFVAPAGLDRGMLWLSLFGFVGVRYAIRREAVGIERWSAPRFATVPIEFREASLAAWKQEVFRMALMAPLLISYGLALAPLAAIPASEAFLCSLLPVLVVLGMQPLADCYKLSERTNDTKQLNLFIFWWGGNGLLILALFVIIRVPDLPIQYAALAVTWLVSISMWWYYDRAYRLGRFDLFPRRSRRRG